MKNAHEQLRNVCVLKNFKCLYSKVWGYFRHPWQLVGRHFDAESFYGEEKDGRGRIKGKSLGTPVGGGHQIPVRELGWHLPGTCLGKLASCMAPRLCHHNRVPRKGGPLLCSPTTFTASSGFFVLRLLAAMSPPWFNPDLMWWPWLVITSIYHTLQTLLSAFCRFHHFILKIVLWDGYYRGPSFHRSEM